MVIKQLSLVATMMLLSGCVSNGKESDSAVDVESAAQAQLAEAAAQIAASIRVLEETRNYIAISKRAAVEQGAQQALYIPNGMDTPITLNSVATPLEAIRLVGQLTDYKVTELNPGAQQVGAIPLKYKVVPAVDVLRSIGARMGDQLHIKVIPNPEYNGAGKKGVIELRYGTPFGGSDE